MTNPRGWPVRGHPALPGMVPMPRALSLFLVLALARATTAEAQWSLTLERGSTSFSATAHDTSSPPIRLVPWHPALYTLRLTRGQGRFGWGIALGYGGSDLGGRVGDVTILPGATLQVVELAPEFSYMLRRTARGGVVRAYAGPLVDRWFPSGDDPRSSVGGFAGAALALPVSDRWELALRADFAVLTSELTKAEASAGVIREPTMRRGRFALGVTRHL